MVWPPPVDFDSDKKEDLNTEMGKSIKENLQPKDMEVSFTGNNSDELKKPRKIARHFL